MSIVASNYGQIIRCSRSFFLFLPSGGKEVALTQEYSKQQTSC